VKLLTSVLALFVASVVGAAGVEVWTRAHWNEKKGVPGFFLSDPARGQRLAPEYAGWFAGVPVRIDALELRDPREYALEKSPRTFRILVLGDSVTFGHGSIYEHTYPYLLERRLRAWRPDVDWQVWNAAVPGYNTSQELAELLEVGPRFKPDLVVVGFFENDFVDNYPVRPPGLWARMRSAALTALYRHVYSIELYKRLYLQLAWRVSGNNSYHQRLAHVAEEEQLTAASGEIADARYQQLTPYDRLPEDETASTCPGQPGAAPDLVQAIQREPGWPAWVDAVRRFQQLHRDGIYRVVFFANVVPFACDEIDRFVDGGSAALNRFYMQFFSAGTPAVSVYDAFRRLRPSQMPFAEGHALGNANAVMADVLFAYLRDDVLGRLLPGR
jgi:hypothetical protein